MRAIVPTAQVDLVEADVEGTVLGSLLCNPEAMMALGSQLDVDWFSDTACRVFAEAMLRLHRDGHRMSVSTLIAAVSPDVEKDGLTRGQFVAKLARLALPVSMLSGPVSTLKDRWARRILAAEGERLSREATAIDVDPHESAVSALAAFDLISEARGERMAASLANCTRSLLERIATGNGGRGATTGLAAIDRAVRGYMPQQLYVVAGRPGMGKSALACSSLRQAAEAGFGVGFFSLEMSKEDVAARCTADAILGPGSPFYGTIIAGEWNERQGDAITAEMERQAELPMHVDATARLTMPEIASRARSLRARFDAAGTPLAVVVIDHMGLVEPSDRYAGNKVAETGQVSRAAKVLAKELGVCVVLLCQLSREVEKRDDKRPVLSDLRWSGDIEQDADVVMFLYREEYYLGQDPGADPSRLLAAQNRLEVLVRKNRNGPPCDVPLYCSIAHSAVRDMEAR